MYYQHSILSHYYDHMIKSGVYPVHPCQAVIEISKNTPVPCCAETACETCSIAKINQICCAMDLSTFRLYKDYFFKNKCPLDSEVEYVCCKDKLFFVKGQYILDPSVSTPSAKINWIVEKILIVCLFTCAYQDNNCLLNDLMKLLNNPRNREFSEQTIIDFLEEYRSNELAIPSNCEIGRMLNQSIVLVNQYTPQINIKNQCNVSDLVVDWFKDQINIKRTDTKTYA